MKQILIAAALIVLVLFGAILFIQYRGTENGFFSLFNNSATITINDQTYKVAVAKTNEEKEIGLSEKETIADNQGMIFTFDTPGYYSFWMKKMKFPIDIIFLRDNKIVQVFSNVQPPASENESLPIYTPSEPVDMVLELKAEQAGKNNLKKGDGIKVDL